MSYKFNPLTGALDLVNDIDPATLYNSDIGVTVQPFDPDYVQTEENYTTEEKQKLAGIEEGATADQTAAEVKSLYESNLDTNAYTDAEKSKLAGVEAGAQVNVKPDWNAAAGADAQILNQPTLGTAAAADVEAFEPADPTILKEAAIGTTVQPFSPHTVIDSEYSTVKQTAQSALQSAALNGYATEQFVLENSSPGGLSNPVEVVFQTIQTVIYNQGGNSTLNNSTHNVFSLAANGTGTTIAHSNIPATGNRYGFELHLDWTSGTITWPGSWTKGDSPPTAIGSYVITGVTVDGGTSWKIAILAE